MMEGGNSRPRRIVITGVTVSGNMGGTAMLLATMDAIRARDPEATFSLLSVTPKPDRAAVAVPGLTIVSAHYIFLLLVYLPLSIILWPFRSILPLKRLLSPIPYFKALAEADVVVDLAGIAFVDGRGAAVLAYNVACCLPALMLQRPIVKLAQALGPFDGFLNRQLASFVLQRCRYVVARGRVSEQQLKTLGIGHALRLPDVSFVLDVSALEKQRAGDLFKTLDLKRPIVVVSPSEVVRRIVDRSGERFVHEMAALIEALAASGYSVVLVPHSLAGGRSRNNDRDLCRAIEARVEPTRRPVVIDRVENPRKLRAIIGEADGFIGCRFHAAVAALSMTVPSLIIGWGHKYQEMAEGLLADDWIIDAESFSAERAAAAFMSMMAQRQAVAEGMKRSLPAVKAAAEQNFDLVIESSNA